MPRQSPLAIGDCARPIPFWPASLTDFLGQKVLIYGASGSVGTFAVQLARYFGAEVTGVCSSPKIELVQSLGANEVLDYTKDPFSLPQQAFDLVFDAVGKMPRASVKQGLKPKGKFVSVTGQAHPPKTDLLFIKGLIESGKLTTVIDRTYKLSEIQAAHRYVEQFRKRGNVSVRVV